MTSFWPIQQKAIQDLSQHRWKQREDRALCNHSAVTAHHCGFLPHSAPGQWNGVRNGGGGTGGKPLRKAVWRVRKCWVSFVGHALSLHGAQLCSPGCVFCQPDVCWVWILKEQTLCRKTWNMWHLRISCLHCLQNCREKCQPWTHTPHANPHFPLDFSLGTHVAPDAHCKMGPALRRACVPRYILSPSTLIMTQTARFPATTPPTLQCDCTLVLTPFIPALPRGLQTLINTPLLSGAYHYPCVKAWETQRLWPSGHRAQAESVWEGQSKFRLPAACATGGPHTHTHTAVRFLLEAAPFPQSQPGNLPSPLRSHSHSPANKYLSAQERPMVEHTLESNWGPQTWSRI